MQIDRAVHRVVVVVEGRSVDAHEALVVDVVRRTEHVVLIERHRRNELERGSGRVLALRRPIEQRILRVGIAQLCVVVGRDAAHPPRQRIGRVVGHCDHRAVVHVEHDDGSARRLQLRVARLRSRDVLFVARREDSLREGSLRRALNLDVDRQPDVVADGAGVDIDRRADLSTGRINLHRYLARPAPELRLVRGLHAAATDEVAGLVALRLQLLEQLRIDRIDAPDVAEQLRGQPVVRIRADGQLGDIDTGIRLPVFADRELLRQWDTQRDDCGHERRLPGAHVVREQRRLLDAEHLGQLAENAIARRLREVAVDGDGPGRDVLRQHLPVPVENLATRRLGLDDARAERAHGLTELLLRTHLQEPQAREKRRKEGDDHDADNAHPDAAVVAHAKRGFIETRCTLVAGQRARSVGRVSASTRRPAPGRRSRARA